MAPFTAWILKPKLSRVMYVAILFIGTTISLAAFSSKVRHFFIKHSYFCDRNLSHKKCDVLVGHMLLFRVFIGLMLFFLLLAVINCQVTLFTTFSNWLENGLWIIKFNVLFLLIFIALIIPEGHVGNLMMHVGWVAAFLTMVIQVILVIDFGLTWNNYWVEKMELSQNPKVWYFSLLFITSMLYTSSVMFTIYLYVTYGSPVESACKGNIMYMSITVLLCVFASLLSVHPKVREAGLLQAGLVTSYATYLMGMSLYHNPQPRCNPTWSKVSSEEFGFHFQTSSVFDVSVTFLLLLYGVVRIDSMRKLLSNLSLTDCCLPYEDRTTEEDSAQNDERLLITSFLLFYLLLILVAFHILMTLSDFYTPEGATGTNNELIETDEGIIDMQEYLKFFSQWVASCLKMTVCIILLLFYIWTVISPVLFSNHMQ